jgi:hypothetical protein
MINDLQEAIDTLLEIKCFKRAEELWSWNEIEVELHEAINAKGAGKYSKFIDRIALETAESKLKIRSRINNHIDKLELDRFELASYVCKLCIQKRWVKASDIPFTTAELLNIHGCLETPDDIIATSKLGKFGFLTQNWFQPLSNHPSI